MTLIIRDIIFPNHLTEEVISKHPAEQRRLICCVQITQAVLLRTY